MQWYPPCDEKELGIFVRNWIGFSRFKASLTAFTGENEVCAVGTLFLMPYKKVSHYSMFYMIVDPKKTGRKIGSSLLKNILNLGKNYFHLESVVAEVFEGAPINSLLRKNFDVFTTQKNYVKEDGRYRGRILYRHCF